MAHIEDVWRNKQLNQHLDATTMTREQEIEAEAAIKSRSEEIADLMPNNLESMQAVAEIMAEDIELMTVLCGFVATSELGDSDSSGITIESIVRKLIKARALEFAEHELNEQTTLELSQDLTAGYWEDEILKYQ